MSHEEHANPGDKPPENNRSLLQWSFGMFLFQNERLPHTLNSVALKTTRQMSPTCRQWMIVSRSCIIFQGSRTMIITCTWIQQSDSSLLHCSFGLFLKQSELIQSHFDNNSVHFVSSVLMPILNYTLFQENNQTKSIDHSSEKATPGSSVEHIEPLGRFSCRLSASRYNKNNFVSRECRCADVAWRACKLGWQAPRKQPQPPPVKLWAVPVSKWAFTACNQFKN